jgi:cysteine desulfurase
MIYLDNNATTQVDPRVLAVMAEELSAPPANPSSIHEAGRKAHARLQDARRRVAQFFGRKPTEVTFTSGATEAMNQLLRGLTGHIISTQIEHACVYEILSHRQNVTFVPVGIAGAPTVADIAAAIRPDTKAIVLSSVNGETGVKLDVPAIVQLGIPVFLDVVAHVGKEPIDLTGVAGFVVSAHKFHGPKGVGALVTSTKVPALLTGGHQESDRRAGTENLPAIVGFAEALRIVHDEQSAITHHLLALRSRFETSLLAALPHITINGQGPRTVNVSNICFTGYDGETLLLQLDQHGIAASHGSACASGSLEPSRVLTHMSLDKKTARSSVRFSFSRMNTIEEIDEAVKTIVALVSRR